MSTKKAAKRFASLGLELLKRYSNELSDQEKAELQ